MSSTEIAKKWDEILKSRSVGTKSAGDVAAAIRAKGKP